MHIQLQAAPPSALRLEFDRLEVQPGAGGHRLALRYAMTPVGLPAGATVLLGGHLQVRDAQQRLLWLSDLTGEHLPVAEASYPRDVTLGTTISDLQLLALEDRRGGGDLLLLVNVRLTVAGAATLHKDPRERALVQRFAALRDAVHGLASGAHHDDAVTETFHYSLADAHAIVACAAALARRV